LALSAFFIATPATRRMSTLLASFASSAESMSMYAGCTRVSTRTHTHKGGRT
jgi:hypothetical protein